MDIISNTNTPTMVIGGTRRRSHQAERSMSCNRRTCTDSDGKSSANLMSHPMTGINPNTNVSSTNHQYSEREARPLKSMYLLRQVLVDSIKSMWLSL